MQTGGNIKSPSFLLFYCYFLVFLAVSSVLNIGLDLLFVVGFHWGIRGAAAATVVSQYIAGIGILLYVVVSQSGRVAGETMKPQKSQQKGR